MALDERPRHPGKERPRLGVARQIPHAVSGWFAVSACCGTAMLWSGSRGASPWHWGVAAGYGFGSGSKVTPHAQRGIHIHSVATQVTVEIVLERESSADVEITEEQQTLEAEPVDYVKCRICPERVTILPQYPRPVEAPHSAFVVFGYRYSRRGTADTESRPDDLTTLSVSLARAPVHVERSFRAILDQLRHLKIHYLRPE